VDQLTETPFVLDEVEPRPEVLEEGTVLSRGRGDRGRDVLDDITPRSERSKVGIVGEEKGSEISAAYLPLLDHLDRLIDGFGGHPEEGKADSNLGLINRETFPSRVRYQGFEVILDLLLPEAITSAGVFGFFGGTQHQFRRLYRVRPEVLQWVKL
jgi:hypothetical protein